MAFQNRTIVGTQNNAYLLVFAVPLNALSFAASSADVNIRLRKNYSGAAQGANPLITVSPMTPPITSDWVHLSAGGSFSFGTDRTTGDCPHDPVVEVDIWFNTSGELLLGAH